MLNPNTSCHYLTPFILQNKEEEDEEENIKSWKPIIERCHWHSTVSVDLNAFNEQQTTKNEEVSNVHCYKVSICSRRLYYSSLNIVCFNDRVTTNALEIR